MYVCVCQALTEKDVHSAVAQGCNSVRELKHKLGLGAECGRCLSCAKGMLQNGTTSIVGAGIQHPTCMTE